MIHSKLIWLLLSCPAAVDRPLLRRFFPRRETSHFRSVTVAAFVTYKSGDGLPQTRRFRCGAGDSRRRRARRDDRPLGCRARARGRRHQGRPPRRVRLVPRSASVLQVAGRPLRRAVRARRAAGHRQRRCRDAPGKRRRPSRASTSPARTSRRRESTSPTSSRRTATRSTRSRTGS